MRSTWQAAKVTGAVLGAAQKASRMYKTWSGRKTGGYTRRSFKRYTRQPSRISQYRSKGGYHSKWNRMNRKEVKFHDADTASIVVTTTWLEVASNSGTCLQIPEGVGEEGRIGRKIHVSKVQLRGTFVMPTTAGTATATDRVRFVILIDHQANGAASPTGDVFFGTLSDPNDFRNLANVHRFTILYDKTYAMNASIAGDGVANDSAAVTKNISIHLDTDIDVHYNDSASTGVITTIESNNITALACSDGGRIVFAGQWRIRYTG